MARYYGSEALRNPALQEKAVSDYALNKLNPKIHNVGSQALNQLSTKLDPKRNTKQTEKILIVELLIFINGKTTKAKSWFYSWKKKIYGSI